MKKVTALRIEPAGECRLVELPHSGLPQGLGARQDQVEGNIEAFYFGKPGTDRDDAFLYINEDGKYHFGPSGYNGLATDLVRHRLFFGDFICGPVIALGTGRAGNDADVPEWVVNKVRAYPDCKWVGEQ